MSRYLPLLALAAIACAPDAKECPDGYTLNSDELCVQDPGYLPNNPADPGTDPSDPPAVDPDVTDPDPIPEPEPEPEPEPVAAEYDVQAITFQVSSDALDALEASSGPFPSATDVLWIDASIGTEGHADATLEAVSSIVQTQQGWFHQLVGNPEGGHMSGFLDIDFSLDLGYNLDFVLFQLNGVLPLTGLFPGGALHLEFPIDSANFAPLLLEGGNPDSAGYYGELLGTTIGPIDLDVGTPLSLSMDVDVALTSVLLGIEVQNDHALTQEIVVLSEENALMPIDITTFDEPGEITVASNYVGAMAHTLTVTLWPVLDVPALGLTLPIGPISFPLLDQAIDLDFVESDWEVYTHTAH